MSHSNHIKIVFLGTPDFAVEPLKAILHAGYPVPAVVTTPDRPAGRGQKVSQSPVKTFALDHHIEVLQPEKLRNSEFVERLTYLKPDIMVVVAFRMLPEVVWGIPRLGTFNLHASLLPQYRGAAPINWAIINGESKTGLTTFLLDSKIDTGKILLREEIEIGQNETAGQLHDRMLAPGANLVLNTIELLASGQYKPIDQATVGIRADQLKPAPKLVKERCRVNWNFPAVQVHNFIRGLSPSPGAWSELTDGKGQTMTVRLLKSTFVSTFKGNCLPGSIYTDGSSFVHVHCALGTVSIDEMQLPGRRSLPIKELLMGFKGIEGYRLQ